MKLLNVFFIIISLLSSNRALDGVHKQVKIAFVIAELSFRGIEVSTFDYAHYNETLLGNESIIINFDVITDNEVRKKFTTRFPGKVFDCSSRQEMDYILEQEQVDILYYQKPGHNDGILSHVCKNATHVVFPSIDVHGDAYAFISEWFVKQFPFLHKPAVPLIVRVEETDENLRTELGIPDKALVFGRYGGFESFNVPCALDAIQEVARNRSDIYFVFLNTKEFCSLPNVIFLPKTTDMLYKSKFINTCDAMIHARWRGETFGLACGEFSIKNKPVITWAGSPERAHIDILGDKALYYYTKDDLINILSAFKKNDKNWDAYSDRFSPEIVMKKFDEIFIQPLIPDNAKLPKNNKKILLQTPLDFQGLNERFLKNMCSIFNPDILIADSFVMHDHYPEMVNLFQDIYVFGQNFNEEKQRNKQFENVYFYNNFESISKQSNGKSRYKSLIIFNGNELLIQDNITHLKAMTGEHVIVICHAHQVNSDSLEYFYLTMINKGYECFVMNDTILAYKDENVFVEPLIKAMTTSRLWEFKSFIGDKNMEDLLAAEHAIARFLSDEKKWMDFEKSMGNNSTLSPYYRLWKGLALFHKGSYQDSAFIFEELIKQNYNHWRLFWYWGKALHKSGDIRAEQAILRVLNIVPHFKEALIFKNNISA